MKIRLAVSLLACSFLLLSACGGGPGYYAAGDVYVENATLFEDLTYFEMSEAGFGAWTGDLLPADLGPGFVTYAGTFAEDLYDLHAEFFDGFFFRDSYFYDQFVLGGVDTTFGVF